MARERPPGKGPHVWVRLEGEWDPDLALSPEQAGSSKRIDIRAAAAVPRLGPLGGDQ